PGVHDLQQRAQHCAGVDRARAHRFPARHLGRPRRDARFALAAVCAAARGVLPLPLRSMKVIRRYLAKELTATTLLVFAALLMLYAFLDLIHELGDLGSGQYRLPKVIAYVLLSIPGHVY